MSAHRSSTVAVVGLGDLGARVAQALARLPIGRVLVVGRREERARAVADQAALVAALTGGAGVVEAAVADLDAVERTAAVLREAAPDVVLLAAARHSWWRTPPTLDAVPYATWLPLHLPLTRNVVRARDDAGLTAPVVTLTYPDAVGAALAPSGLAPDVGAGNVAEVAAKLRVLAARRHAVAREDVDVRLVMHHAAERFAFGAFGRLGRADERLGGGRPPVHVTVRVAGAPLPEDEARSLFTAAYPLLDGRETHDVTAAAAAEVVSALMGDEPCAIHAPAPGGRPGGYPVRASRHGIALDLADGVTEDQAVAVNATAARWDGIERIAPDGAITFTGALADATEAALGWRLEHVAPDEVDSTADRLAAALRDAGA